LGTYEEVEKPCFKILSREARFGLQNYERKKKDKKDEKLRCKKTVKKPVKLQVQKETYQKKKIWKIQKY
jgi:hypothetical protein